MKITKKILTNLIKEELIKTKIADQGCRNRLAGQLYDKEDSLGRRLNPDERRNIINNFRFDITNQCTWHAFEPLITTNDEFKYVYDVLMKNFNKAGDEAAMNSVKASLDSLIDIVKTSSRPMGTELEYMPDMLEILKGIAKKYEDDHLRHYNFNVEDEEAPEKIKSNSIPGEPLVQKQKQPDLQEALLMKISEKSLINIIEEEIQQFLQEQDKDGPLSLEGVDAKVNKLGNKMVKFTKDLKKTLKNLLKHIDGRLIALEELADKQGELSDLTVKSETPPELQEGLLKYISENRLLAEQQECDTPRRKDLTNLKSHVDKVCKYLNYHIDIVLKELQPKLDVATKVDSAADQEETQGNTHTVVKGDTFWELARTYLGNPRRWTEIQSANPREDGTLIPPRRLPIGTVLNIPAK